MRMKPQVLLFALFQCSIRLQIALERTTPSIITPVREQTNIQSKFIINNHCLLHKQQYAISLKELRGPEFQQTSSFPLDYNRLPGITILLFP